MKLEKGTVNEEETAQAWLPLPDASLRLSPRPLARCTAVKNLVKGLDGGWDRRRRVKTLEGKWTVGWVERQVGFAGCDCEWERSALTAEAIGLLFGSTGEYETSGARLKDALRLLRQAGGMQMELEGNKD